MISNKQLIIAISIFLLLIGIGTFGFVLIEDYSLLEGLYMTVITITTVGFGEIKPLSPYGRGFTVILILMGFISLAYAGQAVAASFVETFWKTRAGLKKMNKKISQLKSHYIICGYGRVGAAAVEHFRESNADFVIIEADPDLCMNLREKGLLFLEGDATSETMLVNANIKAASGLIALLNSDPENLFIVLTARELNPTLHIISRADDASSEKKILRAGADGVITPYDSAGRRIAAKVLKATGKSVKKGTESFEEEKTAEWISLQDKKDLRGKSIGEAEAHLDMKIIGLRRAKKDQLMPTANMILEESDMLLALLNGKPARKCIERRSRAFPKIVIIDDNPVILRVFSRLFQKAGFHPVIASSGEEGLKRIIEEKPGAAVIDFMLPGISGIDVCRDVRQHEDVKDIKLIMFTTDDSPETRQQALETGANAVVIKGPNAMELIEEVLRQLRKDPPPGDNDNKKPKARKIQLPVEKNDKPPLKLVASDIIDVKGVLDALEGDQNLLQECFKSYTNTYLPMLKNINNSIETENGEALSIAADRFKGSLIYLGAKKASALALELAAMGKKNNFKDAHAVYASLANECEKINVFISNCFSSS